MPFQLAFIGMPGPMELCIIAFILLLLFGKRVPEMMRSLGSSVTSFKRGLQDIENIPDEIEKATDKAAGEEKNDG